MKANGEAEGCPVIDEGTETGPMSVSVRMETRECDTSPP